jgi:hypothetical protein
MGKLETIADGQTLSGGDAAVPVLEADASASPKMALAPADLTIKSEAIKPEATKSEVLKSDAPKSTAPEPVVTPKPDAAKIGVPAIDPLRIETPKVANPAAATRKVELARVEAPHIAPDMDEPKPSAQQAEVGAGDNGSAPAAEGAGPRVSRFTLLAASLALAAALGGMAGALAAYGLARPGPLPAVAAGRTNLDEIQALKENVVQARVELAALKVSIDSANRTPAPRSPGSASASNASSAFRPNRPPSSTKPSRCSIAWRAATAGHNPRKLRARSRRLHQHTRMGQISRRRNQGWRDGLCAMSIAAPL